ncbi:aminoglycoside phosphotransferase family protein [Peribacillus sp. SCS-155]|uniref:aminoglycoside phosphotransferase family protein n=1 Tax=Peribacillus sedimenti TaxID=3115297 RepID=UPI00390589E5
MNSKYLERINQVYPELYIEDYDRIDIGQNNDVFIINKSFIFRFPKYEKGIENLKKEMEILESINNSLSVPIPNPIYQSFEYMEVGIAFAGYKLIQGTPLWRENFVNIENPKMIKGLATQLTTFLLELHSISDERLKKFLKQGENAPHKQMSELFLKIQNKLFPFVREEAKKEISRSFGNFLNNETTSILKTTLIHGDFGASNILWEPVGCKISGIIDFGASGVGDPAYDFAGLLSSYGENFYNMCINLYPNGNEISERVKFYKSTFALQEALHGIENNDIKAFENGIKDYK